LLQEGFKSRLTEERISKLQLLGFVWYAGPPNGSGPGGPWKKNLAKNEMEEHPQGREDPNNTLVPMVKNDLSTQGAVWYAGLPNGSGPGEPWKKNVAKNEMEEHPQGYEDSNNNTPVPMVKNDLSTQGAIWYASPPNGSGPGGPWKKNVAKNEMEEHPQGHEDSNNNTPVPMVKNDLSTQGATMVGKNRPVSPVTTQGEMVNVNEELDIPLPLLPPLDLTILQTANTLQPPQVSAVAASSSSPGRNDQWELRFQELLIYKDEHGTCRVPRTVPVLGRWVKKQREHNRRRSVGKCTNITLQRLERLDAIGFVWECSQPDDWQTRYLQLKQYKEIHGNCLVPKKHSTLGRVSKILLLKY
jgi:hypothetical protein